MVVAIDCAEEFGYVLKEDRGLPKEEQTTWWLCTLDIKQRSLLEDMTASGNVQDDGEIGSIGFNAGSITYESLRAGLRRVENFRDSNGELVEIEFDKMLNVLGRNLRPPSDKFLSRIHPSHAKELGEAVRENARLTVAEGKN